MKKTASDLKSKIAAETDARTKETELIKKELARIPRGGAPGAPVAASFGPSKSDLEAVSSSAHVL